LEATTHNQHTTHNTHTKLFRTQNEATNIYHSIDEATQNTMAGGVSRQSSDTNLQQYPNCEPGHLRGAGCWVLGAGLPRFLITIIYLGPPDTQHTAHSTQHTAHTTTRQFPKKCLCPYGHGLRTGAANSQRPTLRTKLKLTGHMFICSVMATCSSTLTSSRS
jgi:hypothetical protein